MWSPPVVVIHQVVADIPLRFPQAHALGHAIAPQPLPKCQTDNPVADTPCRTLSRPSQHQACRTSPSTRPVGLEVEHCGQVMPAATCPYVSDVAAPHLIGLLDIRFTRQKIGNIRSFRPRDLIAVSTRLFGDQLGLLHQAAHLESASQMPECPHHRRQSPATSGAPAFLEQASQFASLLHPLTVNCALVSEIVVKTGGWYAESAADQGGGGLLP